MRCTLVVKRKKKCNPSLGKKKGNASTFFDLAASRIIRFCPNFYRSSRKLPRNFPECLKQLPHDI